MKRALLFAAFLPLLGVSSFAEPLEGRGPTPAPASPCPDGLKTCPNTTLDKYPSSCLIGQTMFTNIEHSTFGEPNNPKQIEVIPILSESSPGLTFKANWSASGERPIKTSLRVNIQMCKALRVQEASLKVQGGQFNGGTLFVNASGCLSSDGPGPSGFPPAGFPPGCPQPRIVNSGVPFALEVNETPGSSSASFPGAVGSIDLYDTIVIQGPAGPTPLGGGVQTGFVSFTNQFLVGQPK